MIMIYRCEYGVEKTGLKFLVVLQYQDALIYQCKYVSLNDSNHCINQACV